MFLGLDNAGKTTILSYISSHTVSAHQPTYHQTSQEVRVGNVNFVATDCGGHNTARNTWSRPLSMADAIVFVLDLAERDQQRMSVI